MIKTKLEFGGAMSYHTPLFSFHSIYDIDIGIVNLVKNKYYSDKVFNLLFFDQSKLKIISDIYRRSDPNPLTVFAKPGISKEDLDDYYNQFIEKEYKYIYDECVSTEILNYISMFKQDKEINPTILCYTDYEIQIVKEEEDLKDLKIIRPNSEGKLNIEEQRKYSEFYCKRVEELDLFPNVIDVNFYIASFGPNFVISDDGTKVMKETKVLAQNSIVPANSFHIYDMYNGKYFERI